MHVIDPGHIFELLVLDRDDAHTQGQLLTFVKREGQGYPGNKGHYPGTNIQEVLRACCARLIYLDEQIPDERNELARFCLYEAIHLLEQRAAERHHRAAPALADAVAGPVCLKCGHVGCQGSCHGDTNRASGS